LQQYMNTQNTTAQTLIRQSLQQVANGEATNQALEAVQQRIDQITSELQNIRAQARQSQ